MQRDSPKKMKAAKLDPDGEEDPCEVYISLESSAGCVYYDVTPILRVLGSIMMVTGVLLIIFSIRMSRLFLLVIIQAAVFFVLMALFR